LTGAQIIFVSDTYLPADFVRAELLRHGLAEEGDKVFVSSAFGLTKRSGSLFQHILKSEGISAIDITHHGDNPQSDLVIPKRLGIAATLHTNTQLNAWERAILSREARYRDVSSELAGSTRAFRLRTELQSRSSSHYLVATFLGPAIFTWAAWVLGMARRDGVRRLYFSSRDGYLLCRAARILSPHFDDIDCRYLKVSRQSILLPSTTEISPAGMPWLQRSWEPASLERLIQKLGLHWEEVEHSLSALGGDRGKYKILVFESEWSEFWRILASPPIADLVQERIRTQRNNVLAYLRAEGLFDKLSLGLVDIGWTLTVQSGLQKLLGGLPNVASLKGYYLGLSPSRMPPAAAGKSTALFYDHAADHHSILPRYEIFKRVTILEHIFGLAPHGTVRQHQEIGATVVPVCPPVSATFAETVEDVARSLEAYCADNQVMATSYSDEVVAREIIDNLVRTWFGSPNEIALRALDQVTISDDPNNLDSGPLLESWRPLKAAKTLAPRRWHTKLKVWRPVWPEAAFQRSGPWSKFILRVSRRLSIG
jgi:hypothetical protein